MKILITGGGGRLGRELRRVFPEAVAPSSSEMDIANVSSVSKFLSKTNPDVVVHAAAMTGANECELNRGLAWKTNVEGTANMLKAFKTKMPEGYFVYMSTAGVFKCDRGNYDESAIDYDPVNFYCLTKFCGEALVRGFDSTLIVRTNFVQRGPWPHPKAFTDRFGTYLYADDVAMALKDVVSKKPVGTLHIVGDRRMSMYELAMLATPGVGKTTLAELGNKAVNLPKDMSLTTKVWHPYKIGFSRGV